MKVTGRKVGEIMVIEVSGRVVGDASIEMRRDINGWLGEMPVDQKPNAIIKLNDVSMMDSAGLGALVSSYTTVQKKDGRLVLAGLGRGLQNLIAITKLARIFDVYESEEAAMKSFQEEK